MKELTQKHIMTMSLTIDFAATQVIGNVPAGLRRIVPVSGGHFEGDRLNGEVLPGGHDWVINRADGVMLIDVRLPLKTDDGALIYLAYQGRFLAEPEVMAKMGSGTPLDPSEYSLMMSGKFECGDERYAWLNNVIAVGRGEQAKGGATYTIFELG